ncbi:hypothetical protein J437_LFUL006050 [Ladona fulva]|uniref:Uncharacterized protein n=1 Tax=Ladona fulva TaxID=123851 RepID=A0A8K0JZP3_LADFU|nr:hypothetical protein J437_LFUL006050 [Ladona fulva]
MASKWAGMALYEMKGFCSIRISELPAEVVWVVLGNDAQLPCDIRPPKLGDRVNMVLWFKDNDGIPLYSD